MRAPWLVLLCAACGVTPLASTAPQRKPAPPVVEERPVLDRGRPPAGECKPGTTLVCFDPATAREQRNVGACHDGRSLCSTDGRLGPCEGTVGPVSEGTTCDGVDQDCDGVLDDGAANACGTCGEVPPEVCNGVDDDCDGLVDEGVMSVCGTCDLEPCFVEQFQELSNCRVDGRTCWFIGSDDYGYGAMTLGFGISEVNGVHAPPPLLVLPVVGRDEVVALEEWSGSQHWRVPSGGTNAVRTSSRPDLSAYVVNAGSADGTGAGVVRIDRRGNIACRADISGALTVAVDAFGQGWVSTDRSELVAIATFATGPAGSDGVPSCQLIDLAPDDDTTVALRLPQPADHLAFDASGLVLWTGTNPAARVDARTLEVREVPHLGAGEVVVDEYGNPWFAGPSLHRVMDGCPYADPARCQTVLDVPEGPIALPDQRLVVAVVADGSLWEVSETTLEVTRIDLPEGFGPPDGIASGRREVFVSSGSRLIERRDDTWMDVDPVPGEQLLLVDDVSAMRLHMHGGRWTQIVDSGYHATLWRTLDWVSARPSGTAVDLYVRFADTRDAVVSAPRCGPFETPPVTDLSVCPGASHSRFARVEVDMIASPDGRKPVVNHVQLGWTR
jgi:hypothetical protein